jgi:hypothetical protein
MPANSAGARIRHRLRGTTQNSVTMTGNVDSSERDGTVNVTTTISPLKNQAIGDVWQYETCTDLMAGQSADTIAETRAVGAVG